MRVGSLERDKSKRLEQVKSELLDLPASPLFAFRKANGYRLVFGEGDPDAEIMFIGEAPGKNEAELGRPFVSAAGRVLWDLLESIGLKRSEVYITNIVKDRPPENRDPTDEEMALYGPFLMREIEIVQPAVIATLGRFSMMYVAKQLSADIGAGKITALHGKLIPASASYGDVMLIPLFHPAFALYLLDRKEVLQQDFKLLEGFLKKKTGKA